MKKAKVRKPKGFRFAKGFVIKFVGGPWPYVWVGAGVRGEEEHLTTFEPKEAGKIGEAFVKFAAWAGGREKERR